MSSRLVVALQCGKCKQLSNFYITPKHANSPSEPLLSVARATRNCQQIDGECQPSDPEMAQKVTSEREKIAECFVLAALTDLKINVAIAPMLQEEFGDCVACLYSFSRFLVDDILRGMFAANEFLLCTWQIKLFNRKQTSADISVQVGVLFCVRK